jgi:hypothetical protein
MELVEDPILGMEVTRSAGVIKHCPRTKQIEFALLMTRQFTYECLLPYPQSCIQANENFFL